MQRAYRVGACRDRRAGRNRDAILEDWEVAAQTGWQCFGSSPPRRAACLSPSPTVGGGRWLCASVADPARVEPSWRPASFEEFKGGCGNDPASGPVRVRVAISRRIAKACMDIESSPGPERRDFTFDCRWCALKAGPGYLDRALAGQKILVLSPARMEGPCAGHDLGDPRRDGSGGGCLAGRCHRARGRGGSLAIQFHTMS